MRCFTDLQKLSIVNDYTNGFSKNKIHIKYKIGRKALKELLLANNLEIKTKFKHKLNSNYFRAIDSFYKAYFYGLICADGSIFNSSRFSKTPDKFSISLQIQDGYLVEKLAEEINITKHPTIIKKEGNRQQQLRLCFVDKIYCNNLISHGLTNNKSFTHEFPSKIDDKFIYAFILGYFDGDGSVSICKSKNDGNFSIVGSISFIKKLAEYLEKKLDIHCCIYSLKNINGSMATLNVSGNFQILKVYNFLYKESPFFLKRKYEKFNEIINLHPEKYKNFVL